MHPNHPFPGTRGAKPHPAPPSSGRQVYPSILQGGETNPGRESTAGREMVPCLPRLRAARSTLPRVSGLSNRPKCKRTFSNGSYLTDSFTFRHNATYSLSSTANRMEQQNVGITPRDLLNTNTEGQPPEKRNTVIPRGTRNVPPCWLGPSNRIPPELQRCRQERDVSLPEVQASFGGARPKTRSINPSSRATEPSPRTTNPSFRTINPSTRSSMPRISPAFCVNYNTFISSTLPSGHNFNIQQNRQIKIRTKSVATQSCEKDTEEEAAVDQMTQTQPVLNISRNETIVLPAVTVEGELSVDLDEDAEPPPRNMDYNRRVSQALVDGGFREQASTNGADTRPVLVAAGSEEADKVNELVESLKQLPLNLFTPVNSPQHSPAGSPEPGESGESGVDVRSGGQQSPGNVSPHSQALSQWSMDASRGTPYRADDKRLRNRGKNRPGLTSRISVGQSISFNVTRREGERMQTARNSVTERNRKKAEDLRRTSLKNSLPKISASSRGSASEGRRGRSSGGHGRDEGRRGEGERGGRGERRGHEEERMSDSRADMMEFYLEEQAEMTTSRQRMYESKGRGSRAGGAGRKEDGTARKGSVVKGKDAKRVKPKVRENSAVSGKREEKHEKSGDTTAPRRGSSYGATPTSDSRGEKKRLTPGRIEIAVSSDVSSPGPLSPQRSQGASPVNFPMGQTESARTTPSLINAVPQSGYNNAISSSQPCSRRPSEFIHDMLSISEPCSRRTSDYSGGLNVTPDHNRDSGFGNELNLLMDSKASSPGLLDPQYLDQSRPQSSTSSSAELHLEEDNVGSLPNSPFPTPGRGVMRRRSSSMDSTMSRPGSDLLEVPIYTALAKDRVPASDSPEASPIASPCSLTSSDECYGDLQQQVVHRVAPNPPPPPADPTLIEPQAENTNSIEAPVVAPQVSLTTDDGDEFAVGFGRRGSIFIEEKGTEQEAPQQRTTTNEKGQVSLAVPIYPT